jgi:hypothetical protein
MPPHALRATPGCTLRAAPRRAPLHRACAPAVAAPLRRSVSARGMSAAASSSPQGAGITDVYALDFDGVVCDSVGESAQSAWRVRCATNACVRCFCTHALTRCALRASAQAAEKLWPDVFATPAAAAQRARVLEEMRLVRPVVETGYENLLQVRLLLEAQPGTRPDDMLARWGCVGARAASSVCARGRGSRHFPGVSTALSLSLTTDAMCACVCRSSKLLPEYMAKWKLDRGALVELFGRRARALSVLSLHRTQQQCT